jgi:glycerate kinase
VTQDVDWLIAPDGFKGSFSAREVALAIAAGIADGDGEETVDVCPIADGGEGTLEVIVQQLRGRTSDVRVSDPLRRPITARLGFLDGDSLAIVAVAEASGLALLAPRERDAEAASTFGTGELVAAAVAAGASRVVVAAGGSASTDGGGGAIEAIESRGGLRSAKLTVLAAWVLDALDFNARARRARAVITGEGRLDAQTLEGKAISEVAYRCARAGVPLHAVVGGVALGAHETELLELASLREASDVAALERAGSALARMLCST